MRRSLVLSGGLLSIGMVLAACGNKPDESTSSPNEFSDSIAAADDFDADGHFDFAFSVFAPTWDPIESIGGVDMTFYEPVYDSLLHENKDGGIEPMLATDFTPSEDNKTLTLTLQEGLKFSDGEAFNADAVKFNLDRARQTTSRVAGDLYMVDEVTVTGEYTLELHLSGAIGSLPTALANAAGIQVSPKAAEAGILSEKPVGIGPFVATNIEPGARVDYEASPDYWDPDAQRVATMSYQLMADDQTRMNALRSGEIDGAAVTPIDIDSIASDGYTTLVKPSSQIVYLSVNGSKGKLGDPEVRKALNMSIDREALSEGLYDGYCVPQIQPFPESSAGYSEKIGDGSDAYPYDPEKAKDLLAAAGASDMSLKLVTGNDTRNTQLAEVVQAQLTDVGIDVQVEIMPPVPLVEAYTETETMDMLASQSNGLNDPGVMVQRYLTPEALFNPGDLEYPELAKLGNEAAATLDPEVRKAGYEKFMDAWVEAPPHFVPLCLSSNAAAYAAGVSGVTQKANGLPGLRGVAVTEQ
ncbi:ABC transporter substrate-binding protein [Cumulibacter soli]|uniref:ABC transporter substrate-binding protein n=1 Tax=Cumulibacter soli TaxID=2546344 RepID=UPI00106812B8|nr:ABC transporter substrate-binding protein [Cumulibacter soli]